MDHRRQDEAGPGPFMADRHRAARRNHDIQRDVAERPGVITRDDRTARASADLLPASTLSTEEVTGNTAGSPKHAPLAGQGTENNKGENDAAPRRVAAPAEPLFANPLVGAAACAIVDNTRATDLFAVPPPARADADLCRAGRFQRARQTAGAGAPRHGTGREPSSASTVTGWRFFAIRPTRRNRTSCACASGESYHGWVGAFDQLARSRPGEEWRAGRARTA